MAAGVIASKPVALRSALQPVALALLVTGGVGYYSYSSVTDAGAPPAPGGAVPASTTIAKAVPDPVEQKIAPVAAPLPVPHFSPAPASVLAPAYTPVTAPMVTPVAAPVAAEPVTIKAAAQFAPTAASAPLMGRKHRRITGRFNPAPLAEVRVASLAPLAVLTGQSAALTLEPPVAPIVSLATAAPIAAPTPEQVTAPLVPQITAPELPGPAIAPAVLPDPAVEASAPALVAPPPVAAPLPAAVTPIAPVPGAEPVAALVPAAEPATPFALAPQAAPPRAPAIAATLPAPRAVYGRYRMADGSIEFAIPARIDGADIGSLPLRIGQGNAVSVRLGDLLAILQPRMDAATYDRLSMSRAADEYVGFDALRKAGIAVQYDAAQDQILMGTAKTL